MGNYLVAGISFSGELYHHGIKGQQWGKRRYQNPDGTLTAEGRARLGIVNAASRTNSLGAQRQARFLGDTLPTQKLIEERKNRDLAVSPEWKEAAESQKTYSGFGRVVSDRLLSAEMTNDAKKLSAAVVEGKGKVEEIVSNETPVEETKTKERKRKKASSKKSSKKSSSAKTKTSNTRKKKAKPKKTVHGSTKTQDLDVIDTGATNKESMDFLRRGGRR